MTNWFMVHFLSKEEVEICVLKCIKCLWEHLEVLCRLRCSSLELAERDRKSNPASVRLVGMAFLGR